MNKPPISIDIDEYNYTHNKHFEQVLKNIHLKLHPGSLTTLIGPSGCGKSTLLRLLMGFENTPYKVEHIFSLVPQTSYLFPWKTVFENIALGLKSSQKKSTQKEIASRVSDILNVVGLSGIEHKYPFEISVGMSQRVSFARAMINPFEVLLLDEPFSSLDALTRHELQNWLLKIIRANNSYGLFVTHDISEAIYLSENIYILSKMPATVVEHFTKKNDSFIQVSTGQLFESTEMRHLEDRIFSLLDCVDKNFFNTQMHK